MSWLETYRGTIYRWEVDTVDHFTVAYYFARFEDATMGLLEAIGLGRETGAARTCAVVECRVRYLKELRVGDIMHIRSGVIEADEGGLRLGHEVFNSGDGVLCTSVEQRAVLVAAGTRASLPFSRAQLDRARAHRVDWDGGPPAVATGIDPRGAGDGGFLDTARDTIKPWEVDTLGHAAPPAYVHRFSAANGHLLAAFGMSPAYMREQQRGFSTFDFRLRFPGALRAGDLVRVRSGLLHVGNSSVRILHRLANVLTGEAVATLEQSGVHLDLAARRPTPLPDDLRERAKAMLVTGAAGESVRS